MDWYYADNKQQVGPVSEQDFQELVSSGIVTFETLVWHDGMEEWLPHGKLMPPPLEQMSPAVNVKVCSECGRLFPLQDMTQLGDILACDICAPVVADRMPKERETVSMTYGSFVVRGIAKAIDVLMLSILMTIVIVGYNALGLIDVDLANVKPENMEQMAQDLQAQFLWVQILVNMIYSCFFHGKYGATPGKMACKLKVVCSTGSDISYRKALGRFLGELLSRVFMLGYIIAAFDPQKRALHDMLVDTRVVVDD